MSETKIASLETQLGCALPSGYRDFLTRHDDSLLENAIEFSKPSPGVIDELFTIDQILQNSADDCIGIPEKSLMYIGSNIMGGGIYLKISDEEFGEVYYMENYEFKGTFPSFENFIKEAEQGR